jgi:hypothetical protein
MLFMTNTIKEGDSHPHIKLLYDLPAVKRYNSVIILTEDRIDVKALRHKSLPAPTGRYAWN